MYKSAQDDIATQWEESSPHLPSFSLTLSFLSHAAHVGLNSGSYCLLFLSVGICHHAPFPPTL